MAAIYPFRALQYALGKVPVEKVLTQPYDKISREMQEQYYASHPNNIVRIILGRSERADTAANNAYTRAAAYLRDWRGEGILKQAAEPAFFVYSQRFTAPDTNQVWVRRGFVGLGRLEDYANAVVFPHERTLSGPKQDRLELLRRTRTQFEQIFMLYEDPDRRIDGLLEQVVRRDPDIQVTDEYKVEHAVWTATDHDSLEFMQSDMAGRKLIIADGHHRYETALAYRNEMNGAGGSDRIPMAFFNMNSPGLTVLPTHRVLANLPSFRPEAFFNRAAECFEESRDGGSAIGVFTGGRLSNLRLKPSANLAALMPDLSNNQRMLDVVILHRLLLERCLGITEDAVRNETHITYVRDRDAAIRAAAEGRAQAAFLLNPTRLDQIRDIAYEGNILPQKSTDFYPKLLSGLVIYAMDSL